MKKYIVFFAAIAFMILPSLAKDEPKADQVDLGNSMVYWNYLTDGHKRDLILKFIKLSNGAVRMGFDMPASLDSVKTCMDGNLPWRYLAEFKNDITILPVMFVCAHKEGWFR